MRGESGSGAGFSGGSGGAGGYRFQALAAAYVYAHALAEHSLHWIGGGAVPFAVSAETAGPGDDLKIEYSGGPGEGGILEVPELTQRQFVQESRCSGFAATGPGDNAVVVAWRNKAGMVWYFQRVVCFLPDYKGCVC